MNMSETAPLESLAPDEHHGSLSRTLNTFGNLAITYSGVGAAAGLYSLFGFSMGFSGGTMLWGWVIVGLSWGLMSLLWAELASHYPYAGAVYQWAAILGGRKVGWWVGWIYLFGVIFTLTGYYFVLPASLVPLLGLSGTQGQIVAMAAVCLALAFFANAAGITVLGRLNKYGVALEMGVFIIVTLLVIALAPHHQTLSIVNDTLGTSSGSSAWFKNFLAGGIFVSLWVIYSFENGGTLGEETIDAHRKAPRAVMGAWAVTFVAGFVFILAVLTAIPSRATIMVNGAPVTDVMHSALGTFGNDAYLVLIAAITLLGGTAFMAGAVRHTFSMARDGMLPPLSDLLSRVPPRTGTPIGAIIAVTIVTAVPLLASSTIVVLVTGAVAVMYVAYFLMTSVLLVARLKGWPQHTAPFQLGRWGIAINIYGVLFSLFMMVNLLWRRPATNPDKWGLPVAWWLVGQPLVIGVIYFFAVIAPRLRREEGQSDGAGGVQAATGTQAT
jgi:amino acid transporter